MSRRRLWAVAILSVGLLVAAGWRTAGAGSDPLARDGAASSRGTAAQSANFGAPPIVVKLDAELATTLDPDNLQAEQAIETRLRALPGVRSVLGPSGLLNAAAAEVDAIIAADVRAQQPASATAEATAVSQLLVRYGYQGVPSATNQAFVGQFLFGSGTAPKPALHWLFPSAKQALIVVRPRAGLSPAATAALARRVGRVVSTGGLLGDAIHVADVALPGGIAGTSGSWRWWMALGALPLVLGLLALWWQAITVRARQRPESAAGLGLGGASSVGVASAAAAVAGLVMTLSSVPLVEQLGFELALGAVLSAALALAAARWTAPRGAAAVSLPAVPARHVSAGARGRVLLTTLGGLALAAVAGLVLAANRPTGSAGTQVLPSGATTSAQARQSGTGGQLSFELSGRDVSRPAAYRWIAAAEGRVRRIDPAVQVEASLPSLLSDGEGGSIATAAQISDVLSLVPQTLALTVVNRRDTQAEFSFILPVMSAAAQASLAGRLEHAVGTPPRGLSVRPAGAVALSAAAAQSLRHSELWLSLLAALAIAVVLRASGRGWSRSLLALVPGLCAAGWCGCLMALIGLAPSLVSAALETPLMVLGVVFSLLVEAHYRDHRTAGMAPLQAERTARSTSAPVLAGAFTAIAAVAVLVAAVGPQALRQSDLVLVGEAVIAGLAALTVTPALAAAIESGRPVGAVSTRRFLTKLSVAPGGAATAGDPVPPNPTPWRHDDRGRYVV